MKKLMTILLVLAITAPLFAADVDFAAKDNQDGTCTVTYTVNAGAISAMALNIDADVPLGCVGIDPYFDVFMDSAYMDPENYNIGDGTPIAGQDTVGEIELPLDSFCISAGHLQGIALADEFTICADQDAMGTIGENALRGGVVNTDGQKMTTNLPIDFTITMQDVCFGDVNNDGKISAGDLAAITAFLSPTYAETDPPYTADPIPAGNEAMDANQDGRISAADLAFIVAFLSPTYADTDPQYTYIGCMND